MDMLTPLSPGDHPPRALLLNSPRRRYAAKSTILHAHEHRDKLFLITRGSVELLLESEEQDELIVAYLNTGDVFGELAFFGFNGAGLPFCIRARTYCEVALVEYPRLQRLTEQSVEVAAFLSKQTAKHFMLAVRRLEGLAFLNVEERVGNTLLELSRHPSAMTHPDGMQIKVSRIEIARIAGCSREMVGRALKRLVAKGRLQVSGHTMVVLHAR